VDITLPEEIRSRAIESVRRYFADELDQDIGDLKAILLLDFFLKELAPSVYNRAISDAQAYFQQKVEDLDGSCYRQEFGYWE